MTVPCVVSGNQPPTFMFGGSSLPTGAQPNQYSLDFAAITPESNGSYSCQVGTTTTTFTLNVLGELQHMIDAPLSPLSTFPPCHSFLCQLSLSSSFSIRHFYQNLHYWLQLI